MRSSVTARENDLGDVVRELMEDRNIRRYLALHHPEALRRAERALVEHNRSRHPSVAE